MEDDMLDLGMVDSVKPETVGEPGHRTFNISGRSARGRVVIWMEKEQLFQLALAIKQVTATVQPPASPAPFQPEYPPPSTPLSAEFKASELRLRHNRASDVFTTEAADPEVEAEADDEEPAYTVQFSFTRQAAEELAERAIEIVSAGRPRCPLCGGPIDSDGHTCPRSNGHMTGDIKLS